ncbi:MAG: hypothetical protein P8M34_07010 [Saprospiraceae bacterium]|nr:hypothetical protein [Saprospiraceae bacterium]|tara:strand:+ start:3699 stop:4109 length:411 start_codon:yes stop_codon:yes gene_type:complete
MIKTLKNNILWVIFTAFVLLAVSFIDEPLFKSNGPFPIGKSIAWLAFIAFLIYTVNVSIKENFYKALKRMSPILWTKQIGIDLYIGVTMFMVIVYLNEPSFIIFLLWLIPATIFANLATLLYLALHYDSIVGMLLG